ncbi:MAG: SOS response-associated peptidase [Chitinophagaceae bacterium]|nr:SOS response-associated peptidase [Chitinophagaceae bacterium]MBK7557570.1 SOS response-associated peptidase [Chitinophagaceae bacterium]MBK9532989.1 SOS response-associated peptidase [Chitinophagaceae bacterium]
MCFHYALTKEKAEIEIQLGVNWDDEWQPIFHAAGFSFLQMPVITQKQPGRVQLFNWGLIPHWVKTRADADKLKAQTLNARSETVFEKPSFRSCIPNSRCLVITDGFFEWMDYQKKKYPHFIQMKDRQLFCFAGIYTSWVDKTTGELINSFSILTTDANPLMEKIHNLKKRMPVIVPPSLYKKWLQPDLTKEEIQSFFHPYPEENMQEHSISKRITSRTDNPNVPETLEPFTYPELALLK